MQLLPNRGGAVLDLVFAHREGLVGDVKVGDCLGVRDCYFASSLSQSLLRTQTGKFRQVLVKGCEILCLKDADEQVQASPGQGLRDLLSGEV